MKANQYLKTAVGISLIIIALSAFIAYVLSMDIVTRHEVTFTIVFWGSIKLFSITVLCVIVGKNGYDLIK